MESIEKWFAWAAIKKPLLSLFLCFLSTFACIAGLEHFKFDADPGIYFSDNHKHYRAFKELETTYGRVDSVVLVVKARQGSIYTRKNLKVIEDLTEVAWTLPYSTRVESIANYNYSWSENDELYVEPLVSDALNLSDEQVARIKSVALSDADIVNRLSSTKAEAAMIRIIVTLPKVNRQVEETEISDVVQRIVKKVETENPDLDILVTGNVTSNTVITEIATNDVMTVIPLMYLVIFILLGVFLRSIVAVFAVFVITILSCMTGMGLAAWAGIVVNMMSITAINIVITVTVAHCVHLLVYFFQQYHQGVDKKQAIKESLSVNLTPITLTSVTTALGFLSMNMSNMPPAHDLGNITAVGVMVAFILSLFMLPPFLLLLPVKRRNLEQGGQLSVRMAALADFVIRRKKFLMIFTILLSLGMLALAPLNVMNDKFTENVKMPNQFRIDNAEVDEYFGGLYTVEFDFHAKDEGGIAEPEYLRALERFASWLRQQPEVRSVQTYSDVIKRLSMNMHNGDAAYYRIPDRRDEISQYQLMFEMSQPYGTDMGNIIRQDKSSTRMIAFLPSTDTADLIALQQRADIWVKENMPDYMYYPGEGLAVMWSYLGQEAFVDGLKGALLALLLISLILMLVFKSLRYGLVSLIPNLLPAGIGYGLWAIIDGELNMGQMLVLSITIGIVVDDTVHFLSKYLRSLRKHGSTAEEAVRYAFLQVGPALWITTAVLMLGFGMLIQSGFIPNSNLGILTMCILGAALLLDFFLLPPLLMLLDKNHKRSSIENTKASR